MKFYLNTLPIGHEKVIEKISKTAFIRDFYLGGGTALNLQLGYRESVDFDFFNKNDFDPENILATLKKDFVVQDLSVARGTLNCSVEGIKLQFLHYPYLLIEKFVNWNGINISSVIDVACTKMITVSTRGSKKDFVDIYFLLQKYSLKEIFKKMHKKYKNIDFNKVHILKSLSSFDEAEEQPMPKMHVNIDWKDVKKEISSKALDFLRNIN